MKRASRKVWKKRVAEWQASGLGAKEYTEQIGVNHNTLSYWGWSFRKEQGSGKSQSRQSERAAFPSPVSFIELQPPPTAVSLQLEPFEV